MKTSLISLLVLIVACSPAMAQEPSKAPPEATALKRHYQEDCAAATKSIRDRYVSDLRSLLQKTADRGDLAGAQAILAELRDVSPEADSTSKLTGVWHFTWAGGSQEVTFNKDGALTTSRGEKGRWLVQNNQIVMKYASGHADILMLPIDVKGTNGKSWVGGAQITGTKVSETP